MNVKKEGIQLCMNELPELIAECGGQGSCGGKNRDSASIFLLIYLLDISLNYYL